MTSPSVDHLRDWGLLIVRVGIGLSFIVLHGWFKLVGGPAYWEQIGQTMRYVGIEFAPVFWGFMASFAETFGALLITLGLLFRPAAALLTLNMTVAVISHLAQGEGWSAAAHALHMGNLFLGLVLIGPGRYSVDKWLRQKREAASLQGW